METDDQIICKAYSEIGWSYFGNELDLIEILDFNWCRLAPAKDAPPDKLKYEDSSLHIYFKAKCLVLVKCRDLAIQTSSFMYSETAFSYASQGPFPSQSDWADLDWVDVDLTKEVSKEVAKALIDENDEMKERLILNNGQEEFLKAIKHKNLQKVMANTWKKKKDYWV
jgi:hypothetical protein